MHNNLRIERSVILGFIFNNYGSFVNPSLRLILCDDVSIYVKLRKTWSLVMELLRY